MKGNTICHILCNITREIGGSNPITKYSKIHEYSHEVGKTVEENCRQREVWYQKTEKPFQAFWILALWNGDWRLVHSTLGLRESNI